MSRARVLADFVGGTTTISGNPTFSGTVAGAGAMSLVHSSTATSGTTLDLKSATAMTIGSETSIVQSAATTLNMTSTGVGTITLSGTGSQVTAKNGGGTNITLTGHTHTDPSGIAGSETSTPN